MKPAPRENLFPMELDGPKAKIEQIAQALRGVPARIPDRDDAIPFTHCIPGAAREIYLAWRQPKAPARKPSEWHQKWAGLVQPPEFRPPFTLPPGATPDVAYVWKTEEKGSDVNLGVHLVRDAFKGEFDQAAVLTNDTDLLEFLRIVRNELSVLWRKRHKGGTM